MTAWIMIGAAAALAVAALVWSIRPGFGRLPRGERLERIRQSPNFRDASSETGISPP